MSSYEETRLKPDRDYILSFNTKAMMRLSLGTALLVSTILLIPDTIAILPSTHDLLALLIRGAGLWLTVFIQWSLAFLGILKAAAIINRGIVVGPNGIRISRFCKTIDWQAIVGLAGETRPFISKLMLMKQPAVRLQLYVRDSKNKIKVRPIDSLFFSQDEFDSLLQVISRSSLDILPTTAQVVIADSETRDGIKAAYQKAETKSKLITAYIAIMLVLFTGRGAARNYFYNQAGQFVNQTNYEAGKHYCELSLMFDGTYPFALDRLARCEFRLHEPNSAESHWRRALKMKPDMVSAKVGLSNVLMKKGDYEGARKLLASAIRLEPRDIPALLNLGYLNLKTSRTVAGLNNFESALRLAPDNATVKLLSAQAYHAAGNREHALNLLKEIKPQEVEKHNKQIYEKLQKDLIAQGEIE